MCLFTQRGPTPRLDGLPSARSLSISAYGVFDLYRLQQGISHGLESARMTSPALYTMKLQDSIQQLLKHETTFLIIVTALGAMLSRLSSFICGLLLIHG